MSLLRNVLRKNSATSEPAPSGLSSKSREGLMSLAKKSADTMSIKSAGGISIRSVRSIAESVTSFTSQLFGGQRVPKRRRPEISRLGAPKWYNKDPPEPPEMPGTEKTEIANQPYTAAHAYSWKACDAGEDDLPYCGLVLYSYAEPQAMFPRYFDETRVRGELRIRLSKPDSITSLDVWCLAKVGSVFSVNDNPHVHYHVNVWSAKSKDSTLAKLPVGQTVVFPFEFPVFPRDVQLQKQDSSNVTRLPLPSTYKVAKVGDFSGEIKYYIGVNVKRSGMMSFDDEWNSPFFYFPLRRPIPREPTQFPFISDREDWPFTREEIGGWTITPFGGRGRFRDDVVEIEGLLGVQAPEVYAPGETLRWSVLLWSKHIPALEALSDPAQNGIDAVLLRCGTYGRDVLQPKNAARRNRLIERIAQGRVWRTDDGPPADDAVPPLRGPPRPSGWANRGAGVQEEKVAPPVKSPVSPVKRSRFQDVIIAEEDEGDASEKEGADDATLAEQTGGLKTTSRSPSPASSLEDPDAFPDMAPLEGTVRLDGDVRIPEGLGPSFRYMWMGREYALQVTFTHPEYSHISPTAPGVYAETPIWIVMGKRRSSTEEQITPIPAREPQDTSDLEKLPVVGDAIPLGDGPLHMDLAKGAFSREERPTLEVKRMVAF